MKKSIALTTIGLLLFSSNLQVFAEVQTNNAVDETNVKASNESIDSWMPDKVLQTWVAKELNEDIASITQDDMKKIIYLQDTPDDLSSLKGLEYATNLQNLYLGYSNISDLSPISGLSSIVNLIINDTSVTDLSAIYGLSGLKSIDMSNLPIGDDNLASFLQARGSSLRQLSAMNLGLENINYLSPYTNITNLELSYNKITDLRPLKDFTNTTGSAVGQEYPSTPSTSSELRDVSFKGLDVYYMDGTKLDPQNISDGGIYNKDTDEVSFSNLPGLSGSVQWDYYIEPVSPSSGMRFGGMVKNIYNLVLPAQAIINYVDQDGKAIPNTSAQTINGNVGDAYDASTDKYKLAIDGYTLDESKLPTNATGTLSDTAQTITYVYTKNPIKASDVIVNYADQYGKAIPDVSAQTISGNVGDAYDASTDKYKLAIDGYTLDESKLPTNATGTLSDTAQTVTYVYTKNPVNPKPDHDGSKPNNTSDNVLPMTGENDSQTVIIMILGLASVITGVLLTVFKKKNVD